MMLVVLLIVIGVVYAEACSGRTILTAQDQGTYITDGLQEYLPSTQCEWLIDG